MAERKAEVGVRLKLDDQVSKGTDRIKRSFDTVNSAVGRVTRSIATFASRALAVTVGLSFDRMIQGLKGVTAEMVRQADLAERTQRSIAAMLMAASGADYRTAYSAAQSLQNQLEGISNTAGVAAGEVVTTYQNLFQVITRAGGGIETTVGMTENLATVAGATGMEMQRAGLSLMGMVAGLVEQRDPLTQMVKSFGELDVTGEAFRKATEPERMRQLQTAFAKMADAVRGTPPGFQQLVQTFRNLKEDVLEAFGIPLITTFGKLLGKASGWLQKNWVEVAAFATRWGQKIADFVESAVMKATRAFRWIQRNWDMLVERAKQFLSTIGVGLAAKFAAPALLSAGGRGLGLISRLTGGGVAAAAGGGVARAATSAVGAAAAPVVASHFGQTLVGAGLRAAPALDLGGVSGGAARAASGGGILQMLGGPQALITLGAAAQAFAALMGVVALVGGALYAFQRNLSGLGTLFKKTMRDLWDSLEKLWVAVRPLVTIFAEFAGKVLIGMVISLTQVVNTITWLTRTITNNPLVQLVMRQLGIDVTAARARAEASDRDEAWAQYARDVGDAQIRANEQAIARAAVEDMISGRPPTVNQDLRGSTFNIKQDFRDQDPDRVAIVFQRDVYRAAEARITARTAIPFGA